MAQQKTDIPLNDHQLSGYIASVGKRYQRLQEKVFNYSKKSIGQLKQKELRLARKVGRKDSIAGRQLKENTIAYYAALKSLLHSDGKKRLSEYLPDFDSAKSSLAFLESAIPADAALQKQISDAEQKVELFGRHMQCANELKRKIQQRQQQMKDQLSRFGMAKQLKGMNKQAFYYQQQLNEYKELLKDQKKAERKALAVLRNSEPFKKFMQQHSMLAQVFRLPEDYGSVASLAGLQTRANVDAILAQRFAGAPVNPQEYIRGQVDQAQGEINKLKEKLNRAGKHKSDDIDMPEGFKPNTQKTKSFLKRLEYGTNFQTQRLNGYFPVTTDIALTVGYKLNDKSVIGIGASYKMGWGSGIEHIKLTHEGAGLRSYVDWKLKGSFWISGGYEQNYLQRFSSLQEIDDISVWRQSALLGLSKKLKIGKKKESKIQLLYDFFSAKNNIRTQPLVFRIGYGF